MQRLKKSDQFDEYDAIIQDQLKEGIVESAHEPPNGTVFYLPHHHVVRESAESIKMRIVYDASSKTGSQPSLNDCLNTGPPLQNQLFKVLVRGRFHPVALNGDIRKAFLQVRIRPLSSAYVDDLVTGGTSIQEAREKKEVSSEIFKQASFQLHKWQSNVEELEQNE